MNKWIEVTGWQNPPEASQGYKIEVRRQCFMGIVTHYRYVATDEKE